MLTEEGDEFYLPVAESPHIRITVSTTRSSDGLEITARFEFDRNHQSLGFIIGGDQCGMAIRG